MSSNRRCGFVSSLVLAIFASLAGAPFALSQAITLVQSSTRFAGSSAAGFNSDSGAATTVSFNNPSYLVFDSNGNQFVSDTLNNCVRRIDTAGNITTIAGLAVSGQGDTCNASINATPTPAEGLFRPTGLAIDSTNRLYIADSMHHCIRSLASGDSGVAHLVPVAGTCGATPTASVTPMPNGLAIDAANNLFIALQDSTSAAPVYQVVEHAAGAATANVCLVAGSASANVATACPGATNGIALVKPSGLAINLSGELYIADTGNNCIRKVTSVATTVVGQCLNDGSGTSATALHNPYGLAISPMQTLFISESNPDNVVSFTPGSSSVTIVGGLPSGIAGAYDVTQDGQSALSAPLNSPRGLVFNSLAHLFVADSLNNITRELSSNLHFPTTPVGSPSAIQPITFVVNQAVNLTTGIGSDYTVTSTTCAGSLNAATGATPNTCQVFVRFTPTRPGLRRSPLTITDSLTHTTIYQGLQAVGTGALSLFTPGTSIPLATSLVSPSSIVTDAVGNAYVLENTTPAGTAQVRLIPATGGAPSIVLKPSPRLPTLTSIATDAAGNWYAADSVHGTVSRFGIDGSINASYVTGLDTPTALTLDLFNNLYIAQAGNAHNVIVAYTSGARRIVAGSGSNLSADGVPAINAAFVSPSAITLDLNGVLYFADQGGHRVYSVDKAGIIHIVAGNGTTSAPYAATPQAIETALIAPTSLAVDAAGDLYIAEKTSGIVYVVYPSSSTGSNIAIVLSTGAPYTVNGPINIALDGSSNLFVSLTTLNAVVELTHPNPTLNFGSIAIGNTSAPREQSITNAGTDNLDISSPFSTTDAHFALASGSTTCGTTILTGSICTVGFTFSPTSATTITASSILASNSYNTPQAITLISSGKQPVALTTALSAETAVYGQPFAETVTFGNLSITPTGTITFATAGQTLCTLTGTLSPTTTCSAQANGLAVGQHTVAFNYSGDTNYSAAAGTVTLTILPAGLIVTANDATRLTAAANPTFTGSPAGLFNGDAITVTYVTTATLNSPAGSYPIVPLVSGAALSNYTLSVVNGTLSVTAIANALVIDVQSAARVYATANPTFSGIVTGVAPGDNVVVTYMTAATSISSAGTFPITATVSGTSASKYAVTIHTGTLTINQASTLAAVTASATSATSGSNIVLTSNVTANSGNPAGIVSFFDGTDLLGSTNLDATGKASFTTSNLPVGSHTIYGAFQANTNFTTSAAAVVLTITAPNTTTAPTVTSTPARAPVTVATSPVTATTITSSSASALSGANIVFTANVTATGSTAAGTVSFFDGTVLLGNSLLDASGKATFSTSALNVGSHTIAASFQADNFAPSSANMVQSIAQVAGNFTLSASQPAPFIDGTGSTTYLVTVQSVGAFGGKVNLTCAGLPANVACSFATPTVTLTAGGIATTAMTVTNAVSNAKLLLNSGFLSTPADFAPLTAAAIFPTELTGLGVLIIGRRRRKSLRETSVSLKTRLPLMILFTIALFGLMGCGASNTAFKTYTINITGTSLTFPAPVQSTSVFLSVGQP